MVFRRIFLLLINVFFVGTVFAEPAEDFAGADYHWWLFDTTRLWLSNNSKLLRQINSEQTYNTAYLVSGKRNADGEVEEAIKLAKSWIHDYETSGQRIKDENGFIKAHEERLARIQRVIEAVEVDKNFSVKDRIIEIDLPETGSIQKTKIIFDSGGDLFSDFYSLKDLRSMRKKEQKELEQARAIHEHSILEQGALYWRLTTLRDYFRGLKSGGPDFIAPENASQLRKDRVEIRKKVFKLMSAEALKTSPNVPSPEIQKQINRAIRIDEFTNKLPLKKGVRAIGRAWGKIAAGSKAVVKWFEDLNTVPKIVGLYVAIWGFYSTAGQWGINYVKEQYVQRSTDPAEMERIHVYRYARWFAHDVAANIENPEEVLPVYKKFLGPLFQDASIKYAWQFFDNQYPSLRPLYFKGQTAEQRAEADAISKEAEQIKQIFQLAVDGGPPPPGEMPISGIQKQIAKRREISKLTKVLSERVKGEYGLDEIIMGFGKVKRNPTDESMTLSPVPKKPEPAADTSPKNPAEAPLSPAVVPNENPLPSNIMGDVDPGLSPRSENSPNKEEDDCVLPLERLVKGN